MTTPSAPPQGAADTAAVNGIALAGFIVGVITVAAVLLRPYWLLTDAAGAVAIVLGFIGLSIANRTGGRKQFAIWAIALGFTPLIPLLLYLSLRFDYY